MLLLYDVGHLLLSRIQTRNKRKKIGPPEKMARPASSLRRARAMPGRSNSEKIGIVLSLARPVGAQAAQRRRQGGPKKLDRPGRKKSSRIQTRHTFLACPKKLFRPGGTFFFGLSEKIVPPGRNNFLDGTTLYHILMQRWRNVPGGVSKS